ncbi:MAG: phospholipase [Spirochaetaceae bacterium]|nr:MAG: phospholipase [Spirochaetaceae bacterium]
MHEDQPVRYSGEPLEDARAAMIMLHGRGASAEDMITLSEQFSHAGLGFVAPQARDGEWFRYSFLVPVQQNEPGVSSAMVVLRSLVLEADLRGIAHERIFLFGFDQGACLVLEFAARHARRYGGVLALGGGLIGPPGTDWESQASLDATPVYIGCADVDPHVPASRVEESAQVLKDLGARVDLQVYPGLGHTIGGVQIEAVNAHLERALS